MTNSHSQPHMGIQQKIENLIKDDPSFKAYVDLIRKQKLKEDEKDDLIKNRYEEIIAGNTFSFGDIESEIFQELLTLRELVKRTNDQMVKTKYAEVMYMTYSYFAFYMALTIKRHKKVEDKKEEDKTDTILDPESSQFDRDASYDEKETEVTVPHMSLHEIRFEIAKLFAKCDRLIPVEDNKRTAAPSNAERKTAIVMENPSFIRIKEKILLKLADEAGRFAQSEIKSIKEKVKSSNTLLSLLIIFDRIKNKDLKRFLNDNYLDVYHRYFANNLPNIDLYYLSTEQLIKLTRLRKKIESNFQIFPGDQKLKKMLSNFILKYINNELQRSGDKISNQFFSTAHSMIYELSRIKNKEKIYPILIKFIKYDKSCVNALQDILHQFELDRKIICCEPYFPFNHQGAVALLNYLNETENPDIHSKVNELLEIIKELKNEWKIVDEKKRDELTIVNQIRKSLFEELNTYINHSTWKYKPDSSRFKDFKTCVELILKARNTEAISQQIAVLIRHDSSIVKSLQKTITLFDYSVNKSDAYDTRLAVNIINEHRIFRGLFKKLEKIRSENDSQSMQNINIEEKGEQKNQFVKLLKKQLCEDFDSYLRRQIKSTWKYDPSAKGFVRLQNFVRNLGKTYNTDRILEDLASLIDRGKTIYQDLTPTLRAVQFKYFATSVSNLDKSQSRDILNLIIMYKNEITRPNDSVGEHFSTFIQHMIKSLIHFYGDLFDNCEQAFNLYNAIIKKLNQLNLTISGSNTQDLVNAKIKRINNLLEAVKNNVISYSDQKSNRYLKFNRELEETISAKEIKAIPQQKRKPGQPIEPIRLFSHESKSHSEHKSKPQAERKERKKS